MTQIAAGLLMCRKVHDGIQFFLVHPGGPYFKNKDAGWWSIPKGVPEENEDLLTTAQREFKEETGITPTGPFFELGSIKQKNGKVIYAWAFLGTWSSQDGIASNEFTLEWPPKSGLQKSFPEIDKASWMNFTEASKMIKAAQVPFLENAEKCFNATQV